jgi:subtilisin family serine protease
MRSLVLCAALLLPLFPASARAAEGDIIVKRAPGLDSAERAELRADAGVELVSPLGLERTELVSADDPAKALAALRADDEVVYAEPDRRVRVTRLMDDPGFGSLWGLENTGQRIWGVPGTADADIDATAAWDQSEGAGVTVAVVDTGISAGHVDLAGQIATNPAEAGGVGGVDDDGNGYVDDINGYDFTGIGDNDPKDGNGHGTHVSGTIAAEGMNHLGVVGVAPLAKLLPLRALDNDGDGYFSDIAEAFDYAGDNGVRIVNASLGGPRSYTIEQAIAAHPNTLYVVAAGNAGANADVSANAYPCALPEANVICVGATDNRDQIASFSNYGRTAVDLFAPGVDIVSTYTGSPTAYMYLEGTSMASPHVAGAAALALSLRPSASTAFLRSALLSSVDAKPGWDGWSASGGRLNANAAVTAIQGAEPPPVEAPAPDPPVETPAPTPPVPTPVPPAPTPTPDPVAVPAPKLTKLKVSGSLRGKTSKLRVSFKLSLGAWVKYTVTRKGAKSATASWTSLGRTGVNTLQLRRKLPGGKTLRRGSYTLTVAVPPTATGSKVIRVR